jgi:hydroxypyruvate reductase/glycerate 2-kinase
MTQANSDHRSHARAIWQAAVDAARPETLIRAALADAHQPIRRDLATARRILVVGAGKAGAAMSAAVEAALPDLLPRIEGVVNVPAESVRPLHCVRLHAARPAGSNQPTADGVVGARQILDLLSHAGTDDVALCLISGGGSALLPAPAEGITLEDKQQVTQLLHACGATINEMNCVRKHLSAIKGGKLADAFTGRALYSLIISDVIGDSLDVIASGPTAVDPTTFADALRVLKGYHLDSQVPAAVVRLLESGAVGVVPDTLKRLPGSVHNHIVGNNQRSLQSAQAEAEKLGYRVLNLGSYIEGETRQVAVAFAGIVRSLRADSVPLVPPVCLLSGGETTVTLSPQHGRGGRNQEFVLAALLKLGNDGMQNVVVLSGGTDGEDGPTDAAGAAADASTWAKARSLGLDPGEYLRTSNAYSFFDATGDLLRTGLTETNVMDVRVILVY